MLFSIQRQHESAAPEQQIKDQSKSADQVYAVQRSRQIEEGAFRMTCKVNACFRKFLPAHELRNQKAKPQGER